jgi:hypothetical protein
MKRKRKKVIKHPAYPVGKIKTGSIRILFRDTYIRFILQLENGRSETCQTR